MIYIRKITAHFFHGKSLHNKASTPYLSLQVGCGRRAADMQLYIHKALRLQGTISDKSRHFNRLTVYCQIHLFPYRPLGGKIRIISRNRHIIQIQRMVLIMIVPLHLLI